MKNKNKKRRNRRRNFKRKRSLIARCTKSVSLPEMYRLFEVSEIFDMQASSQVFTTNLVANGLFNPGGTNFNAQPVGFNEYMALYTKYRVLKSSISLQIINNGDAAITGAWIVVYPSVVSSSLAGSVATATCQPKSKSVFLGNYQGVGIARLRNQCTSQVAFGESAMLDENFSGDFGSNPAYKWYWIINLYSLAGSIDCQALLKMKFWTKLYARIPLLLDTPSGLQTAQADTNQFVQKRYKNIKLKPVVENDHYMGLAP